MLWIELFSQDIQAWVTSASDRETRGLWRGTRPRMNERMDEPTNGDNSVLWDAAMLSWNARRMIPIFTNERNVQKSPAARKGHLGEGRKPPPVPGAQKVPTMATRCGTIALMFTGRPTVNVDHFKRSRPQCVYLANVKFTQWKRGARIDTPRRGGRSPPCHVAREDREPIVLYRGGFASPPRGVARVTPL